ncbi:lysozyme inhibitor LprI family protein [Herbaspirillum autotrophicum]|uniref:lysozyme inhibitor LprI family protein n=1 Tax=Herbaspirillum autotrophicum TaxID=180195 RepID=UPI00067B4501|nr:lysozyme inhibitor LprI family protein [Herbaspirillum autotrophicum]
MKKHLGLAIICTALYGCSAEVPKCSDLATLSLVKQILVDFYSPSNDIERAELVATLKPVDITLPLAEAHDEKVKRYSCSANIVAPGANNMTYTLPIKYASQLDDKDQHVVQLHGIARADLINILLYAKQYVAAKTPAAEHAVPVAMAAQVAPDDIEIALPPKEDSKEKTGLCTGLDMAVTSDQLTCTGLRYEAADKELNSTYKQLMASLNTERKAELKSEQIVWIKKKEKECSEAGKEVSGGSLEGVLISDCHASMTEDRLKYLQSYK